MDRLKGVAVFILLFYILLAGCCLTRPYLALGAGEESAGKETWRRVGETVLYRSNAPTQVTVTGNSVLVPVTLEYQGNQVDIQLLLDTGSSTTVINGEVADRLNINLGKTKRTYGRVVGGGLVNAYQVTVNRLSVGPHTKERALVFVIPHRGPAVNYDGLLGMDILRNLKYTIDLEKRLMIWE